MTGTKTCVLPFPMRGQKNVKLKITVSSENQFASFKNLNPYDLFIFEDRVCAKMSPYEYTVLTSNTKYVDLQKIDVNAVVERLNIDSHKKYKEEKNGNRKNTKHRKPNKR
jgi:hypothetical protein